MIIACIGEGAMGQVYAAYDPELDRKVALKLLKMGGTADQADSSSTGHGKRLQREAKALSRLAHPNVVSVFDVGTLGNQVFVAMEFVEGMDLHQWSQQAARSWRDVLDVYIQAGRGLAAAHAAGLVHRDFKPHNAILGGDGLEIFETSLGATHQLTANSLNNMANVHWWKQEYDVALKIHSRALEIRLKTLGPDHPDVATSYMNIGLVHESTGNPSLAQKFYEQCMELRTRVLGPHDLTIFCLNNLGSTLFLQKEYAKAQVNMERVVASWTRTLGAQHPNLAFALAGLTDIALTTRWPRNWLKERWNSTGNTRLRHR